MEILEATGISLNEFTEENNSEAYPYVIRLSTEDASSSARWKMQYLSGQAPSLQVPPFHVCKGLGNICVSCPGLGEATYLNEEYLEKLVERA